MEDADIRRLWNLLCDAHVRFRTISRQERWHYQQCWRECYCAELKARTGKWTCGPYDWNTFDLGFARCLRGAKALDAYQACSASDFLIVPEGNRGQAVRCHSTILPHLSSIRVELYVFAFDLEWTVVFAHEGPFFSMRDWIPGN